MNFFDYILRDDKNHFDTDEGGNIYISADVERTDSLLDIIGFHGDANYYYIIREEYDLYNGYDIVLPAGESFTEIVDISNIRRPYYRMRGRNVTKEQAFDIIRRTDNFFRSYVDDIWHHKDFISCYNFDNWLIEQNHFPKGYGWIHVDGTVGVNTITQRYPTLDEMVAEWVKKLVAFPYLDLVIAVTGWDEVPFEVLTDEQADWLFRNGGYDDEFLNAIVAGICVHDKKIEILDKKDTIKQYKKYNSLYGQPGEKFEPEYYEKRHMNQVDLSYLKKCIESYDLNADKVLSKVPQYVIRGIV